MRFILETITGRKGIKNFSSLEEYVDFMTKNGDKIKNIVESDLPYDDKPVSVATPSQSNGWEQVNKATFGDVIKKAEKGDCVLPHKASSVFKDEAKFEPSKFSEKEDTSSEPKVDSTPVKNNNEGSEKDLPKFEYKDEEKSSSETSEKSEPKEEKKDSEEKDDKKKEQVDEGFGDKIHDFGVKAKQKLGIGLSGEELEEYINEYFVYVFMIANHQIEPNHPSFEKIANKLIKTDSKMENVHEVVMSILEDKYYMKGFPADIIEDLLKRRLAKLGIDESIIDKAYETFVNEEKNVNESFDEEIEEALKIAGVQLNEGEEDPMETALACVDSAMDDFGGSDDEYLRSVCKDCAEEYGVDVKKLYHAYTGHKWSALDKDEEYDDVDEDVNNPNDGDVDEKTGKEKLMEEDPSANFNQDEVDDLMAQYERAESDYHAADFYDDNYSWNKGRSSASSRMSDIENKLKQLTGKSYKELLDTLGSKQVDEDKGPSFKVGDKFNKNGRTYEIEKIEKSESKSRDHQYTNYWYHVREIDGSHVDVFTDSLMKELGFKPIAQ